MSGLLSPDAATRTVAEQSAIRNISFGRRRIERGYSNIEISTGADAVVDLGEPFGKRYRPTNVHVIAKRSQL